MQNQNVRQLAQDLLLMQVDRLLAGFALVVLDDFTFEQLFETLVHVRIILHIQRLSVEGLLLPSDVITAPARLLRDQRALESVSE